MARRQGPKRRRVIVRWLDLSRPELEGHISRHHVRLAELWQVLDDRPAVLRDGKGYLLVGCTLGGRILVIPITSTSQPDRWRPKSAYDAGPEEVSKYGRNCGS